MSSRSQYRAYMLDQRLRRSLETPYAYAYDDVTGLQVFPLDRGAVQVTITYSDGSKTEKFYDGKVNAYGMAEDARSTADKHCAEIRKARNENQEK